MDARTEAKVAIELLDIFRKNVSSDKSKAVGAAEALLEARTMPSDISGELETGLTAIFDALRCEGMKSDVDDMRIRAGKALLRLGGKSPPPSPTIPMDDYCC